MKVGLRNPSPRRSFSARSTGKINRNIKSSLNPTYGKKGMGYIKDPKQAVYNKVYNKTTYGLNDSVTSDCNIYNDTDYYDSGKSKTSKAAVFFIMFVFGVILCTFSHFVVGLSLIIISVVIALLILGNGKSVSDISRSNTDEDYKPSNLDSVLQTSNVVTHVQEMGIDDIFKEAAREIQYDNSGNGIYLDRMIGNKFSLCHIDKSGSELGRITGFPAGAIFDFRISNNGLYSLLVSQNQRVFFADLKNHAILWDKMLKFNNYKIKDITDSELIFTFRYSDSSIDFSLDYSGEFCNIDDLVKCFVGCLPPVQYHSDGYILVINELLKDFVDNKEKILTLYNRMTTPKGIKYLSTKKIANVCKSIGKGYFETKDYETSYDYFNKALLYDPKAGVKTYMNKLEKVKTAGK